MVELCCEQPAKQTKEKSLKLKLRQQTAEQSLQKTKNMPKPQKMQQTKFRIKLQSNKVMWPVYSFLSLSNTVCSNITVSKLN
jgi:hypothetical protein